MKKPEEIKRGLEYICTTDVRERVKKFKEGIPYVYTEDIAADALALIQQLEAERDALIKIAREYGSCETCKHHYQCIMMPDEPYPAECFQCMEKGVDCPCPRCTITNNNWEWRGVKED